MHGIPQHVLGALPTLFLKVQRAMQNVKLLGELGDRFGTSWSVNCANIRDIFKLIECQTPGFRQYLIDAAEAGAFFSIQRGEDFLENENELLLSLNSEDILISLVPAGEKGGTQKLIVAALIVAALFLVPGGGTALFTQGGLTTAAATAAASVAVNLAITGISQLLTSGPDSDVDSSQGYLFNGPVNTARQGIPVPVCYGELVVGGTPVAVSFRSTPYNIGGFQYNTPFEGYYGNTPSSFNLTNGRFGGAPNTGALSSFASDEWDRL